MALKNQNGIHKKLRIHWILEILATIQFKTFRGPVCCVPLNENLFQQAILFCSILRHLPSIWQSMAYWTSVEVKTVSPSELFLVLKSYLQNRHFLVMVETEYTQLSPVNAGVS
jgi:hypothetical protein